MFCPAFPTCHCYFLNQWEASKCLDSESAEGCWCCCTAFWRGSSRRWAVGKMHRRRSGEGQKLLRQQKIKLWQRINFLPLAHAPKRFLPRKRGSCAFAAVPAAVTPVAGAWAASPETFPLLLRNRKDEGWGKSLRCPKSEGGGGGGRLDVFSAAAHGVEQRQAAGFLGLK